MRVWRFALTLAAGVAAATGVAACGDADTNHAGPAQPTYTTDADFPPAAQLLQELPGALVDDLGDALGCVIWPSRESDLVVVLRDPAATDRARSAIRRLGGQELAEVRVDQRATSQLERDRVLRDLQSDAPGGTDVLVNDESVLDRTDCPRIEVVVPPERRSTAEVERWVAGVQDEHPEVVVVYRDTLDAEPGTVEDAPSVEPIG